MGRGGIVPPKYLYFHRLVSHFCEYLSLQTLKNAKKWQKNKNTGKESQNCDHKYQKFTTYSMRALIIWCNNINLLLVLYLGFVLEKVQRPLHTFGEGRDMVTPKYHSSGLICHFFWLYHFQKKKEETQAFKSIKKQRTLRA